MSPPPTFTVQDGGISSDGYWFDEPRARILLAEWDRRAVSGPCSRDYWQASAAGLRKALDELSKEPAT